MKGKPEIIDKLNFLLADELTAINQYFVHAEECADWGYEVLHESIEKRSIGEMKHAEKLISRILFLEGTPVVDKLNKIYIAEDVPGMLENDKKAEEVAIKNYNEAIKLAAELLDNGTKELPLSAKNFSLVDQWGWKYASKTYDIYGRKGFQAAELEPNETLRSRLVFSPLSPLTRPVELVYEYSNNSSLTLNT